MLLLSKIRVVHVLIHAVKYFMLRLLFCGGACKFCLFFFDMGTV